MSRNLAICPVCGGNEIEREECVNCGIPLSRFIERPKQHGGARPHPPGREGGRPKNRYPTRPLKLQMTDDEWKHLLSKLPKDTRKRAEYLLRLIAS